MGSPKFALPSLSALAREHNLVGVVTQPDRPAGRGQTLTSPPVRGLSLELGLPVIQPRRLREPEAMEILRAWQPDLIVVAAFGQILRAEVLELPHFGCINVHASLLPRWRGAAPIQAALLHGDWQTGVTIMQLDPGVDTGAILAQRSTIITPSDNAGTLIERLAHLGAELLLEVLPAYLAGSLPAVLQDDSLATYAPLIKKEEGLLDLSQTALQLANQVRAFNPWPGASFNWQGQAVKVHGAHAEPSAGVTGASQPVKAHASHTKPGKVAAIPPQPGQSFILNGQPALQTGDGLLVLDEVQPAGKKRMSGKAFLSGARGWGA